MYLQVPLLSGRLVVRVRAAAFPHYLLAEPMLLHVRPAWSPLSFGEAKNTPHADARLRAPGGLASLLVA